MFSYGYFLHPVRLPYIRIDIIIIVFCFKLISSFSFLFLRFHPTIHLCRTSLDHLIHTPINNVPSSTTSTDLAAVPKIAKTVSLGDKPIPLSGSEALGVATKQLIKISSQNITTKPEALAVTIAAQQLKQNNSQNKTTTSKIVALDTTKVPAFENGSLMETLTAIYQKQIESNIVSESKVKKLTHPRIKYSGVKMAPKVDTTHTSHMTPKTANDTKKQDGPKIAELTSPLNLDNLFPHVMSGGASFAQYPHLDRAISGDADDHANYADIDDIELPDGSKIGYPTDIKRISNPMPTITIPKPHHHNVPIMQVSSQQLNANFGRIEPDPKWIYNPSCGNFSTATETNNDSIPTSKKEPFPVSITRLSFSSDTCDLTPPCGMGGTSGGVDDSSLEIYACRHCGKTYRWKSTLRRHENDECGDKKPAHECPYCPYKAKQRGNLGVHVRKHHFNKPQLETIRKKRSSFERNENARIRKY